MKLLVIILTLQGANVRDRLIGLLELPQIFGSEPCEFYRPAALNVYERASEESNRIATIEVLRPSKRTATSACEQIQAGVRRRGAVEELPVWETRFATLAAVAFERSGDWFRIQLQSGSGWVKPRGPARFNPYPELMKQSLTYIPKGWDGNLWMTPGAETAGRIPAAWRRYLTDNVMAEVLEYRILNGELWMRVRLDPEYGCELYPKTLPKTEGWLPAYRASGQHSVWFFSRGC